MKNRRLLTCGWCKGACMLLSVAVGVSWVCRLWLETDNTLYIHHNAPRVIAHEPSILGILQNDSDKKKQVKDIEFQKLRTTTVAKEIRTIREQIEKSTTPAIHKKGNFEEWKKVMLERQARVSRICRSNYLILKRFNIYNRFTIDTKHHLAYCRNAKAGTTTMLAYMLELAGVNVMGLTPQEIHEKADHMFSNLDPKRVGMELNRPATTIIIARHPFTRLISAYREKILSRYKPYLQSTIISMYRKKLQNKSSVNRKKYKENNSNLAAKVQEQGRRNTTLININRVEKNYESSSVKKKKPSQTLSNNSSLQETELGPEFPTFREFVMYVTDKILKCFEIPGSTCMSEVDIHWRPLHERCAPCDINYKVIAKIETFADDMNYLCQSYGLPIFPTTLHKTEGPSSLTLYKLYSSTLSPEELERVYKAYHYDFLLFDYPYNLD